MMNEIDNHDATINMKIKLIITTKMMRMYHRLRRVGMRKMRRRRRLKTANKKGAKFRSKETKGRSREFTPEEQPKLTSQNAHLEPLLTRPYFDTGSLKYVLKNTYFDSILFKIRIFKIRTLKYLSSQYLFSMMLVAINVKVNAYSMLAKLCSLSQ